MIASDGKPSVKTGGGNLPSMPSLSETEAVQSSDAFHRAAALGGSVSRGPTSTPSFARQPSKSVARSLTRSLTYNPTVDMDETLDYAYAARSTTEEVPKHKLPPKGMSARDAFQIIKDVRSLDTNPRLNLASFVTTWMEPEAEKIMVEAFNVNFVDAEQYTSCWEVHDRCLRMLADLYHAPDPASPTGTSCIGSSEAIMLAGLAMKKAWQVRMKEQGKDATKPNIVMSATTQVVWEKFCRYFDVEERTVPVAEGRYVLTPEVAREHIDENTIGLVGILGSTYTGEYEDIEGMDRLSEQLREEKGWEVPVHVDAASGGFVAPFIHEKFKWDFRLKNVKSINVSGHKYGLVYCGIGWVLWREQQDLPEDMIFWTNYLGKDLPNITMNFSKPAMHIIGQYYQLLRLGFGGYAKVMKFLNNTAKYFADRLMMTGDFELLSNTDINLPLIAFRLVESRHRVSKDGQPTKLQRRSYDEFDLVAKLKESGWSVPAYRMAANAKHVTLCRVVFREDMTKQMADELIDDIMTALEWLDKHYVFSEEQMQRLKKQMSKFEDVTEEIWASKRAPAIVC